MKKGLVIEGGGVRASYACGVLLAFKELKFDQFDVVTATSSGACCGANFVAGEPEKNRFLLESYTKKGFVKFQNILTSKNVVDIDFLIDQVLKFDVPLNDVKIKNSNKLFLIAVMDYQTGKTVYFNNREHDIFEVLRASCAMPYMYRKKVLFNGRRYLDGGMVACIPLDKIIEEGCKEIFVIRTREKSYRKPENKIPIWVHRLAFSDSPAVVNCFQNRHIHYNRMTDLIDNPPPGITIYAIAPKKKLSLSRLSQNNEKINTSFNQGYEDALSFVQEYIKNRGST